MRIPKPSGSAQWPVTLPGYDCVGDVNDPALNFVAHGSVRPAIQENAIQSSTFPDGVVAGPRTVCAKAIPEGTGGPSESCSKQTQYLARRTR